MENKRSAWIQVSDFTIYEIGEVDWSEIQRLWGGRWAQKCIRDTAEQVAVARFSPLPRKKYEEFCPPQLGFENDNAMLVLSPWYDVKPAILYGEPIQEFISWNVVLHVKRGDRLFGFLPIDFSFEVIASQQDALELIEIFFHHTAKELPVLAKSWKERTNEQFRYRTIGAFFL